MTRVTTDLTDLTAVEIFDAMIEWAITKDYVTAGASSTLIDEMSIEGRFDRAMMNVVADLFELVCNLLELVDVPGGAELVDVPGGAEAYNDAENFRDAFRTAVDNLFPGVGADFPDYDLMSLPDDLNHRDFIRRPARPGNMYPRWLVNGYMLVARYPQHQAHLNCHNYGWPDGVRYVVIDSRGTVLFSDNDFQTVWGWVS